MFTPLPLESAKEHDEKWNIYNKNVDLNSNVDS